MVDILPDRIVPALSATSDMPVAESDALATPEPTPEPAPEPVPTADPEPAPEPQKGIQRRFSELTTDKKVEAARREAAEEYARKLEEQNAELRKLVENVTKPPEPKPEPIVEQPRPRRADFSDPDAFDAAYDTWVENRIETRLSRERAEREQSERSQREQIEREEAQRRADAQLNSQQSAYMERRNKFAEEHPDFAEIVEADNLAISSPMAAAIMTDENGPEVAYYLGQHPEEATRIASMTVPGMVFPPGHPNAGQAVPDVQRQLVEMGKIFAAISATPAPRLAVPTAPPPITPVRRGSGPAVNRTIREIGDDPDGMAEYAAQRIPQLRAERKPGGVFGQPN